ncbi:MAG: prepilin-type N-terminal cleavage/methylation domain-containing protein [Candidatus Omnitrophica bacterium]|nr:prepilin-type N-terminal cleavage/methylation domain-containing protein [Candidatus Omnitrophota bacterium]
MNKKGFTLIEMLAGFIIGFIVVSFIYMTFKTTSTTIFSTEKTINRTQKEMSFLYDLSTKFQNINPNSKKNNFSSDSITIECFSRVSKKIITYNVEQNPYYKEDLICKEADKTYQTELSYTCLRNKDDIYFTFFDGKDWVDKWFQKNPPSAIAINIKNGGNEIFFPILMPVTNNKHE